MRDFTVLEADYHRNGVGGEGFYVGVIQTEDGRMLVTWFPEYSDENETLAPYQSRVAVLNLDKAHTGNIYMHPVRNENRDRDTGNNAWRGADQYGEAALAIKAETDRRSDESLQSFIKGQS